MVGNGYSLLHLVVTDLAALTALLMTAVRDCASARCAVLSTVVVWAALLVMPLRAEVGWNDIDSAMMMLTLLLGVAAGLRAFLRVNDQQRLAALADVRRAERMEMAADLHDFAAHHVTGILVQTQVARMLGASDPDRLDSVLTHVETAATETLDSMRRLVGVLRTDEPEGPVRPAGDLAQLADLIDDFTRVGPVAVLSRDASVPDTLPHEIRSAAFRVVQEALTNVRRHAAATARVEVRLRCDGGRLEVCVQDDGSGDGGDVPRGGARLRIRSGGAHRAGSAPHGELIAGPRPEGGWEVLALLPVTPAVVTSSAS